jgi:hypothetical protein
MAGPNLPVNVDVTYPDSGTDSSVKTHQQHHDAIHAIVNLIDKDAAPSNGDTLLFNSTTGLYVPGSGGTPSAATTTVSGVVELATTAETQTGTDTVRAVTPAALAARTFGLANLAPGQSFYITSADSSVTWTYNSATITARPTARTDVIMVCRTAGTSGPSWAITGWDLLERAGS